MITKILTSADKAKELNFKSGRDLMLGMAAQRGFKWNGRMDPEHPVVARVDFGRWMADCSCRNSFYVDPNDPVFFCPVCGNLLVNGALRPVIFPLNIEEVESELLLRRVQEPRGMPPVDTALNSISVIAGLARCWNPDETVADLKAQRIQAGG